MPRARCPESVEAEQKYYSGMKLVDIATCMNVPPGTVRRWKSDQGWGKSKPSVETKRSKTKGSETKGKPKPNAVKRKRGAPFGNKNARGGPPGNIKRATHGAYLQIYDGVLTDEEREMLPRLAIQSERDRLTTLYGQHQVTELRLMAHINAIQNGAEMITHRTVSTIEPTGKRSEDGQREITKVVRISQEQQTRKETLRNFTDALTRVRTEMRRVAEALAKLDTGDDGEDIMSAKDILVSVRRVAEDDYRAKRETS